MGGLNTHGFPVCIVGSSGVSWPDWRRGGLGQPGTNHLPQNRPVLLASHPARVPRIVRPLQLAQVAPFVQIAQLCEYPRMATSASVPECLARRPEHAPYISMTADRAQAAHVRISNAWVQQCTRRNRCERLREIARRRLDGPWRALGYRDRVIHGSTWTTARSPRISAGGS